MSQTYEEIYKKTLREIESMCLNNAERIDRLCEAGVNTDVDLGMAYTYRKILDYIIKNVGE